MKSAEVVAYSVRGFQWRKVGIALAVVAFLAWSMAELILPY